jgi:hypothetical protein
MFKVQAAIRLCFVSLMVIAAQAQTAGSAALSLSPPILRFSAAAGSNPAAALNLSLTAAGSPWTATASAPWLTVSPASGTGNAQISVTAQTTALLPGYYSATVQFTQGTATASVIVTLGVSVVAGKPIVNGNQWFAAPLGSSSGNGSSVNPWDIGTALSNTTVQPGDTIWLRAGHYGAGTAASILTSSLVGTPTAPIIVRAAPGERVIIDTWLQVGCCDQANNPAKGSYIWFWGLEFAGFNTNRTSTTDGTQLNHAAADTWGDGTKFINCIVHDTGGGLSVWDTNNSELYGNLLYNIGGYGPDRGHGHDLYLQNNAPSFLNVADNIGLNNFDEGFQAYGSTTAAVQNMTFGGNIVFNSGVLDGILVDNFTIGGGGNNGGPSGITLDTNYTYDTPNLNQGQNELGYLWTATSNSAVVVNNYFIGGFQAVDLERWNALTFQNNTMYVENGSQQSWLIYNSSQNPATYTYGNNTYYGADQFWIFPSCNTWPCPQTSSLPNGYQTVGWTQWQSTDGLDSNSTFNTGAPGGTWVYVRPNLYEPGRANIVIYNWGLQSEVSVNLAPSGIQPGTPFQIRDAENWFAAPVVSGTYTGNPVTIPMSGLTVVQPVGTVPYSPTHTAPQFGAFVLLPGNAYPTTTGSPLAPVHR